MISEEKETALRLCLAHFEEGCAVELEDMLLCRERRTHLQTRLLAEHHRPLISFCMNVPGPVKTTPELQDAFASGKNALEHALAAHEIPILDCIELHERTGDELLLAVGCAAQDLKKITIAIEESHPLGRIFDLDVLNLDGTKLSRPYFRKCLVCAAQAQACARARRHSILDMRQKLAELLADFIASR